MATFTSTLPEALLQQLGERAKQLKLPKNKLIEKAVRLYLDQLNKAEYLKSYKQMSEDTDILMVAEEGMDDYYQTLEKEL